MTHDLEAHVSELLELRPFDPLLGHLEASIRKRNEEAADALRERIDAAREARRKPGFSVSQLSVWERCELEWSFRYEERAPVRPGIERIRGSAAHHLFAEVLRRKAEGLPPPEDEEVREIAAARFVRLFSEAMGELPAEDVKASDAELRDVLRISSHFSRVVAPQLSPTHVERPFRLELEGYPFALRGFLDVQEGTDTVRDFKVSAKAPRGNLAEDSIQLSAYALAVRVLDGKAPAAVRIDTLWTAAPIRKPAPKWISHVSTRGWPDFEDFLSRCATWYAGRMSGVRKPAPRGAWFCSADRCSFFTRCAHGARARVQG